MRRVRIGIFSGSWKGRSIEPEYVPGQNGASVDAMRIAEAFSTDVQRSLEDSGVV